MKILIIIAVAIVLSLLPLIPTTTTMPFFTKVPEQYTITETYTEYVPKTGERAVYHDSLARTEWRSSIKSYSSIDDVITQNTRVAAQPSYYTIEYYTYMKAVAKERQVTKTRLVNRVIDVETTQHISVIDYLFR